MRKSVDELKKIYEERERALKAEKAEAIKQAVARNAKKDAAEKAKIRRQENHVKMILGGYLLSDIIKKKDKALLSKINETLKSEKDKKLISGLV